MEPVTAVLLERRRDSGGLSKMLGISLVLHVLVGAALIAAPFVLGTSSKDEVEPVMTISLPGSGAAGPVNGGSNPMGGRPVQTTEPARKPEPVRPPAERTPEMTMPAPKGKPAPKASAKPETLEEGSGHTPSRGAELRPGSAFGETGAQGSGFGLSTGGLGGGGMTLDVGDFCCPEYLMTLVQRLKENWNEQGGAAGEVVVKFTIQRDGTLTNVGIERSSNVYALDAGAQRAVVRTARLPPLPAAFDRDHLTVALTFRYQR